MPFVKNHWTIVHDEENVEDNRIIHDQKWYDQQKYQIQKAHYDSRDKLRI